MHPIIILNKKRFVKGFYAFFRQKIFCSVFLIKNKENAENLLFGVCLVKTVPLQLYSGYARRVTQDTASAPFLEPYSVPAV